MRATKLKTHSNYLLALLLAACVILIVLHGFENHVLFKIDEITIGLLIVCFIPLFQKLFSSIKAGGVELQFREYSVHEQIFIFLDGIASKQAWTFFTPRKGEVALGQGFKVLIDELVRNKRKELIHQVEEWLESKNDNHKWFAAEVIGYGKLDELKDACKSRFENLDINEYWEHWQLNCLWAYSTFYGYEPLTSQLKITQNEANRVWMIVACIQMIREDKDGILKERLLDVLNKFPKKVLELCEDKMDKAQVQAVN